MHEIAIIGGGLMGYTTALAFARAGFSIVLLEAKKPDLTEFLKSEGRAIVLAHTSCILFRSLDLWSDLLPHATPIRKILISEQHSFGKCRMDAQDYQLDALGHVVPATALARCLFEAVEAHPKIQILAPFSVNSIETGEDQACINGEIFAKLILACDGTDSFARDYFNLQVTQKDYQQQAIVANLTLTSEAEQVAIQRFTDHGVLALLPLGKGRMTSVLTVDKEHFDDLINESSEQYIQMLQNILGKRQGLLSDLGKRFSYPLTWMQANETVAGRTVLMGNAAHTISPIAAQGLNIALRDLAMLYDRVIAHRQDLGDPFVLAEYAQASAAAQSQVMQWTDQLNEWVKPRSLRCFRSAGLFALDHLSFFKHALARSFMGLSSHGGSLMREENHAP